MDPVPAHDARLLDKIAEAFLSKDQRVHRAVNRGNPLALERAIANGGSVEYMPRSGFRYLADSPVHIAIQNDDLACLIVLIRRGAHLSSAGLARKTPLAAWFDVQADQLRQGASVEDIPQDAWEIGALLVDHGAKLGSGGRGAALSGMTPQQRIDQDPHLSRIQRHLHEFYRADRQARAIDQATGPLEGATRPRSRL